MSAVSHSSTVSQNALPPQHDAQRTTSTLTPYLRLPHLLSLTWLAYPILSLLFVAFRLQLSLAAAQTAITNAKDNLLTSCKAAEQAATSAASTPRLMAIASNQQFVDSVNGTLDGARYVLVTSLTILEAVMNFAIDLYQSTFLCFLELVVRGALSLLITVTQEANNQLQSNADGLRTGIQNSVNSANNAIQGFANQIDKLKVLGTINPPQIAMPDLDSLNNVSLPSSISDSLTQLNASLPTVAELKDKLEAILDTPFELVKKDINETFARISFNSSLMPIPDRNTLSFCNDVDLSVVDNIHRDLAKTALIGTLILLGLALLFVALNCLWTWYKWRSMKAHLERTRQAWLTDPAINHTQTHTDVPQMSLTDHNLLMLQADASHPFITRIANWLSRLFRLSPTKYTHTRWFLNYIFHPPAVAVLLIGFFGLLCVELQLIAMAPLEAKYKAQAVSTVSDYSNVIANSINNSMYNQSSAYANEVNARIDTAQSTLNDGLFGWVNQTTTTLNSTINEFYTDVQNAVTSVFGGTILEKPAQDFVRCFIGGKVNAIEHALTFLHDNLQVDMPRMNQSALVLSPGSLNETVQPIAAAAIGGGADDNDGVVGKLVNSYAESLKQERIMFIIFIGLWLLVVLMGVAVVLWHSCGRRPTRNRKQKKWMKEKGRGIDDVVTSSGVEVYSATVAVNDHASRADKKRAPRINSKKPWYRHFNFNWPEIHAFNWPEIHVKRKQEFTTVVKNKPVPRKDLPPVISEEKKQPAWLGKMNNLLNKKTDKQPDIDVGTIEKSESKLASDDSTNVSQDSDKKSRKFMPNLHWPDTIGDLTPNTKFMPNLHWPDITIGDLTRNRNSVASDLLPLIPSASPPNLFESSQEVIGPSPSTRPAISPPQPLQSRHSRGASLSNSSDVGAVSPQPQSQLQPPPIPIPLHHGFDNGHSRYLAPPSRRNYYQNPATPSVPPGRAHISEQHRRSVSFPVVNGGNMAGVGVGSNIAPSASTGLTRLLTGSQVSNARQSSMSENPFITPFDDEHRVEIDQPAMTRRSIPTNPFEGKAF